MDPSLDLTQKGLNINMSISFQLKTWPCNEDQHSIISLEKEFDKEEVFLSCCSEIGVADGGASVAEQVPSEPICSAGFSLLVMGERAGGPDQALAKRPLDTSTLLYYISRSFRYRNIAQGGDPL